MTIFWRRLLQVLGALLLVPLVVIAILEITSRLRRGRLLASGFPHITTPPVTISNTSVQIYTEGTTLYNDMLEAIRQARKTIFFETFIWKGDALGQQFKAALIARAEAGVQVYIIYDTFANLVVPPAFKRFPAHLSTLHVLPYRALRHPFDVLDLRRYGRDHRKILVVDQQVSFTGGYNIGELYRTQWRDTHVKLSGSAADDLGYAFADFWNENHYPHQPLIDLPVRPWSPTIRVHRNDSRRLAFPIRAIYLEAMEHAQRRILMTQAYFVPDPAILAALQRAARRGVEVLVLVPWQSNHVLADWLGRHHFSACLRSGMRLFGYQGAMIHAKTMTIDGVWSMIGTANMDRMSLVGNYEINVEIFDAAIAAQMEAIFVCDLTNAREIDRDHWEQRPWYVRAGELVLSPLWPLV